MLVVAVVSELFGVMSEGGEVGVAVQCLAGAFEGRPLRGDGCRDLSGYRGGALRAGVVDVNARNRASAATPVTEAVKEFNERGVELK